MVAIQNTGDYARNAYFSIYVYHANQRNKANPSWEMKGVTYSEQEAIDSAQLFYDTSQFIKVEVKKRVYDTLNAQSQDVTIKVFQENQRQKRSIFKAFLALIGALFMVAGSFYLNK